MAHRHHTNTGRNKKYKIKNSGESTTLTFTLDKNDLAFVNADLKTVTEPGDFDVMIGDKKATFSYK